MTDAPCPPPREPSAPKIPTPPLACCTHAHVFGPVDRFPYAADRSYTPPDAPLEKYLAMLATLGVLGMGVVQMIRGGDPRRSNKLMQSRVAFQGLALLLLALLMMLVGRS